MPPERTARAPVLIAGAGSWGTTLALHLARQGRAVELWARDPAQRALLARHRENRKYLPGHLFPDLVHVVSEDRPTFGCGAVVFLACPSHGLRELSASLPDTEAEVSIILSKGLEEGSGLRMSEVARETRGGREPVVLLTGPSLAREVAEGLPAALVAASTHEEAARTVQGLLAAERFRVYTCSDLIGAELAGALKNVVALAAGIADGLGLGCNARGALLTRGMAEIRRLGEALGARGDTFLGLAGMGDLVTTCTSPLSRNHSLGERLGKGASLDEALAESPMVAEGVRTTRAALALAERVGVELPIASQVARVLFHGVPPHAALRELMTRPLKSE